VILQMVIFTRDNASRVLAIV